MAKRELRISLALVFGLDRNLYVVNAYYQYSEVLKFKGGLNTDGQHDFVGRMRDVRLWKQRVV